jgi:hypothetical protein
VKEKGQGGPEGEPKSQSKPNHPEQPPQSRGIKSPERQLLLNVWDVLERMVYLHASDVENRARRGSQENKRKVEEVDRLIEEIRKNGTFRDKNTFNLYKATVSVLGQPPVPLIFRDPTLEEFRQLRSRFEPMSDRELAKEVRKAEAELEREAKRLRKHRRSRIPGIVHH